MLDVVVGPVTNVIDGNTFTIHVTHIGNQNKFAYSDYETVRIDGRFAANVFTGPGVIQKRGLISQISGKTVRCSVKYRDQYNVLISNVEII